MSLSKRDREELLAVISDLNAVARMIEDARDDLAEKYRTVGGQHFYTPLSELVTKVNKVRSTLQEID